MRAPADKPLLVHGRGHEWGLRVKLADRPMRVHGGVHTRLYDRPVKAHERGRARPSDRPVRAHGRGRERRADQCVGLADRPWGSMEERTLVSTTGW